MWKRATEYLSFLKCVRVPLIYASVFAVISVGTFSTQSGLISLPFFQETAATFSRTQIFTFV